MGYIPYDQKHIDELVQERRNSIALAMELRLSCTNPSTCELLNLGVNKFLSLNKTHIFQYMMKILCAEF